MRGSDRNPPDRSQRLRALERAWRDDPSRVYVRLAEAYHLAGRDEDARAVLSHGLAETPGDLAGQVLRGRLAAGDGRLDEARRDLEDALARFPDHHGALMALADLRRLSGEPEAERDVLEQLRELLAEPWVLGRLAELDADPDPDARPRMPPARRPTATPRTRPSASIPEAEDGVHPTRADTVPAGPAARPGMFVRSPSTGGGPDPFVNATMAELLASQGDLEGALRMFAELVRREPGRRSHRERYAELGGDVAELAPAPAEDEPGAADLERALRDLVEGS